MGNPQRFTIRPHTWVQVPGTVIEVYHEGDHQAGCALNEDGSLTLQHPEFHWSTRMMPPAVPERPEEWAGRA